LINILWKAPFTSGTTSVSNRFRSSGSRSWPTKKLFSIAFASVHPTIIKTFHYYYDHIIEINWFSIYILTPLLCVRPKSNEQGIRIKFGNILLSSPMNKGTRLFRAAGSNSKSFRTSPPSSKNATVHAEYNIKRLDLITTCSL